MRVLPLYRNDPAGYSCVVYWVLGENNTAADRNTLIDTGGPGPANLAFYLLEMAAQPKGIGKQAVEQVILTHGHFDHAGGAAWFQEKYGAPCYLHGADLKTLRSSNFLIMAFRIPFSMTRSGMSEKSGRVSGTWPSK